LTDVGERRCRVVVGDRDHPGRTEAREQRRCGRRAHDGDPGAVARRLRRGVGGRGGHGVGVGVARPVPRRRRGADGDRGGDRVLVLLAGRVLAGRVLGGGLRRGGRGGDRLLDRRRGGPGLLGGRRLRGRGSHGGRGAGVRRRRGARARHLLVALLADPVSALDRELLGVLGRGQLLGGLRGRLLVRPRGGAVLVVHR